MWTQTAEGKTCNVSWAYYPDDGLQLMFEARANQMTHHHRGDSPGCAAPTDRPVASPDPRGAPSGPGDGPTPRLHAAHVDPRAAPARPGGLADRRNHQPGQRARTSGRPTARRQPRFNDATLIDRPARSAPGHRDVRRLLPARLDGGAQPPVVHGGHGGGEDSRDRGRLTLFPRAGRDEVRCQGAGVFVAGVLGVGFQGGPRCTVPSAWTANRRVGHPGRGVDTRPNARQYCR